jgi:hypothetical protein
MLTARSLELLAPLLAFAVVIGAALTSQPMLIALLAIVWFLPWASARVRSVSGALDEREADIQRQAERLALRVLLLIVCALPLLPGRSADDALRLIRIEWVDASLLLVAVFIVRALWFAGSALGSRAAAHYAGGIAAMISCGWVVGSVLLRPGFGWQVMLLALVPLAPHLVAGRWLSIAGALWIAGAVMVPGYAVGSGMIPVEVAVTLALLALPWATAGWWSLKARPAR